MSADVQGIEKLLVKLDGLTDTSRLKAAMGRACALVEGSAIMKAPKDKGQAGLRGSITSKVETENGNIVGIVYTPLEYAPYVEYGTGIHAEKGGSSGWWVYVKDGGKSGNNPAKHYSEKEAKRIMAILCSKGLDAHATNGNKPQPFLRPALYENRDQITQILKEGLAND